MFDFTRLNELNNNKARKLFLFLIIFFIVIILVIFHLENTSISNKQPLEKISFENTAKIYVKEISSNRGFLILNDSILIPEQLKPYSKPDYFREDFSLKHVLPKYHMSKKANSDSLLIVTQDADSLFFKLHEY